MASPYQQQGFQRKLVYLGCILALFTGSWVWRQYILADQARDLGVREVNRGDVELSGLLVRLTLTGSRGLATCVLWMMAIDDQRKNQWNELEQKVNTLTQLQPHFVTPWLFQSWNLSYNVSVELDRSADKYFYIARGIELLAKGERQNRYNPDMRWSVGFTYQHKICLHDETNVLRSLFQLSSIPPNKRDRNRFYTVKDGKEEFNWKEFETFCKENPQLIRRLNSGIQRETDRDTKRQFLCTTPESLVKFLADNYKILSPYETPPAAPLGGWEAKDDRLKEDDLERFPVLPPPPGSVDRPGRPFDDRALSSANTLNDSDDAYAVAKSWYSYGMEPLPEPGDLPGESKPITDRLHQRLPKGMTTSIFRQYPARGASYMAERLQQEGWFDDDPWPIPGWFQRGPGGQDSTGRDLFSDGTPAEVRVRTGLLSGEAWKIAYDMWRRHGEDNHMIFPTEAAENNKMRLAKKFRDRYQLQEGAMPPNLRKEDLPEDERETIWEEYMAYQYMRMFKLHNSITNFRHHYERARVEQEADTVQARKLFYQADTLRINASPREARAVYEEPKAMPAWRAILLRPGNEEFRKDDLIQEDTAEIELKYFDLVREDFHPKPWAFPLPVAITRDNYPRSLINQPFLDKNGKPIVLAKTMETVEQRRARPGQKAPSKPVEAEAKPGETPK